MSQPLLSICIPTFNRAKGLRETLESIKLQLVGNDALNAVVEVSISDNCSTDNTALVAEEYRRFFKNYIYSVNKTNIGFDLNVHNVVRQASGVYGWYMGDDDVIINGGLEFMVNRLKDFKYDVIGINAEPIKYGAVSKYKDKRDYSGASLVETASYNDFYFNGYLPGAFSFIIFDRKLWLECVEPDNFIGYCLYYETPAKMLTLTKKKMLFIPQPLIMTGQDCRWAENGTELLTFINSNLLSRRLIELGFSKEPILKALKENSKRIVIMVLRAKGHGLNSNWANLKFIYRHKDLTSFFYLSIATLLYFLPNRLVVLIRDLKKTILRQPINERLYE